jgi:phospholipase C
MGRIRSILAVAVVLGAAIAAATAVADSKRPTSTQTMQTAIKQVVILFQENNSFDEVLGGLCVRDKRCDGATSGKRSDGKTMQLQAAPDIVPAVAHNGWLQDIAIHGGKMDRFDKIAGCNAKFHYQCYTQYKPEQIPNLAALARQFVISDRTFESETVQSWGSHLGLVAAQLNGFVGDGTTGGNGNQGGGEGCDSTADTDWRPSPGAKPITVPACVPKPDGSGPYRPSPVQWVPTIMDRLQKKRLSWRIYAPPKGDPKYGWSLCPVFADCIFSSQAQNMVPTDQVLADAASNHLPRFSVVIPGFGNSQHNSASMRNGDNWIGSVVGAIMNSSQWSSTAIFITYDDCGCFYDHVPPPNGLGIREPMVIISPWAKPGFTDSMPASFSSMLAFVEHTYGLAPLWNTDANAYDYSGAFNFSQQPLAPIKLEQHQLPAWEKAWLRAHPPPRNDPT